jgi:2-amino-4-hydroxy-6-hydroxymethyldihydropteridine diphosphokinase
VIDCFVGLGANLGDRNATLAKAVELLAHEDGFALRQVSRAWETCAVGPPQPRYLNAVARVGSMLSPRATLKRLLEMEEKLGRIRREKWGPRELDLDLLFYGDAVAKGPPGACELPHPRLHERAFVLGPLRELAPELRHPALRKTVEELWLALPDEARAGAVPLGPIRRRLDGPQEEPLELPPEGAAGGGSPA